MQGSEYKNNGVTLGSKYKNKFLASDKKNKELDAVAKRIVENELLHGDCVDWNNDQIEDFLKSLKSVSPNAISRALIFYRSFVKFICEQEEFPIPEIKLEHGKLYELVDYETLLPTIITSQQYKIIKNQLNANVRDKLIFELAWQGLTNEEIRLLKESDITFTTAEDTGMDIAFLKLNDKDRPMKIEDPELVKDMKKCMKEYEYFVNTSNNIPKTLKFKDSKYLIRPVKVGRGKDEDHLANPSLTLQKAFISQNVTCEGVNIFNLNIENIRRSKLIYLLAPQNKKYFDKEFVKLIFGMGSNDGNLYWLETLAKTKYEE